MSLFYSNPERETETYSIPDCEAFYAREGDFESDDGEPLPSGWYYWFCFQGCMPDSDPFGPFKTEDDAISACRKEWDM